MLRPAYRMTKHATERMQQRRINPWHVLYALTKRGRLTWGGRTVHHDPLHNVTVITDPAKRVIVTVYRQGIPDVRNGNRDAEDGDGG